MGQLAQLLLWFASWSKFMKCEQYRGMHGLLWTSLGSTRGYIDVRIRIHATRATLGVPRTEQRLGHACTEQTCHWAEAMPYVLLEGLIGPLLSTPCFGSQSTSQPPSPRQMRGPVTACRNGAKLLLLDNLICDVVLDS